MNKFEIVEDAASVENAEYGVCALLTIPLMMPDNLTAKCCECGATVQHRPDMPKGVAKICFPCALPRMAGSKAAGELHIAVTKQTLEELAAYRKKRGN